MGVTVELVVYIEFKILNRFNFLQGPSVDGVGLGDRFLFGGDTKRLDNLKD